MNKLFPEITPGSIWICKSIFRPGIGASDILCKVLSVNEDNIHIIRKQDYGFTDLPPATFKVDKFLELYMRLED